MLKKILQRAKKRQRLTFDEAYTLYKDAPFFELGSIAHNIRQKKHPQNIVTYVVDRNINYTNICVCGCKFCAFFKSPKKEGGYVITMEELDKKIKETIELGGTQILLQGSHHPDLPISFYEDMLRHIKEKFPSIHIHGFSPPEIIHISKISGLCIKDVLKRLIQAGLDSIPGGGAEILVDRVRGKISPKKCTATQWLNVMETAHNLGLRTTATMMFGHMETLEERILHLIRLRDLQDRTHGFTAFIPWGFQPDNTELKARKITSIEYLRLLAISRIVLDNFDNIQVSWVTMGPEIAQLGLFFGGNDFGSTMIEENVVAATGVKFKLSIEEIKRHIKDAGFEPKQRRMDYSLVKESLI